MFFSISKEEKQNYPAQYHLGNFVVSTDVGWNTYESTPYTVVYKGYVDHTHLIWAMDEIIHQSSPKFLGNFCALVYNKTTDTLKIQTDLYRSFPIYVTDGEVTNLIKSNRTMWTDSLVEINKDMLVTETKFDVIGTFNSESITIDQALAEVDNILNEKTQEFIRFKNFPAKVFLSGGVDSLLVYSYLQKHTKDFTLIKGQYIDYDYFWLMNSEELSNHWGYSQIHHWNEPSFLTSGAPGDEFMLRSPTTADLFLKSQGVSVYNMMQQSEWENSLHYSYFHRSKNLEIFKNQKIDPTIQGTNLHWNLCNIIVNDWQHWHIGNTLTWTPLRDLRIFKILLRLPINDAIDQIMNSRFSLLLIENNQPGLSKLVSDQKNTGNSMKNLADFYFK